MGPTKSEEGRSTDWIDGFLFVGNQVALDLLNTRLANGDEEIELLPDGVALRRWLIAAGQDSERRRGLPAAGRFASPPTEELVTEVRAFRERLRGAVFAHEEGRAPSVRFVKELNGLLFNYPQRLALSLKDGKVNGEPIFDKGFPEGFWGEIAAASAAVLTRLDQSRLRKCQNCVVHFYDISKKGSRRWCSMNLCGNKLKVAAYQGRQRAIARDDSWVTDGGKEGVFGKRSESA